jgi:hypothetical protein
MTPAQRYLSRFTKDVAIKYGLTLPEITGSGCNEALEARRVVFTIARDVLCLGPTETSEIFGTSKQLVSHQQRQAAQRMRKNMVFRLTVRAFKNYAREEFARFAEVMLMPEGAE